MISVYLLLDYCLMEYQRVNINMCLVADVLPSLITFF